MKKIGLKNKNFRMTQSGGGGGGGPNQGVLEVISLPECSDPIDFSFLFLSSLEDAQDSNPRDSRNLKFNSESSKYRTTAVKVTIETSSEFLRVVSSADFEPRIYGS